MHDEEIMFFGTLILSVECTFCIITYFMHLCLIVMI